MTPTPAYFRRMSLGQFREREAVPVSWWRQLAELALLLILVGIWAQGCDKLPQDCRLWAAAIKAMPDGVAKDAAEAEFARKFPEGCGVEPTAEPPTTTTTTTPGPEPTAEPTALPAHAPLIPDEELTALVPDPMYRDTWPATAAAIDRFKRAHPEDWKDPGSAPACLAAGPAGIDAAFQAISDELLAAGIVAGQSISKSGQRSDAIFVRGAGGNADLYAETHLFDYSRACIATGSNAIKGTYRRGPAVARLCPAPRPEQFRNPATKQDCMWSWGYGEHPAKWRDSSGNLVWGLDATLTVTRCCDFCKAIGMGEYGGQQRCSCPLRSEGQPEERELCEAEVGASWQVRGGVLVRNPGNRAQASCEGVGCEIRVCTGDMSACGEWRKP